MRNTGEELYLTWNAYRTSSWNINITGNFSHQTNIVTHINDALKAYNESVNAYQTNSANNAQTTPLLQYAEGQSINTIYGVKSDGIDPETGKEIFVKKDGSLTFVYDVKDQRAIGNMEPKGLGSFGTNITYKQFYFGFNFSYQFGGDYYNQTLVDRVEDADPRFNVDSRALADRWKKPGDVSFYKNIADLSITYPTSRFVQKLNDLSLESVNFTYTVDKKIAKKMGMQSLRLSLTSNDLFVVSSIQQERGIDFPFARSLTCSLQANF